MLAELSGYSVDTALQPTCATKRPEFTAERVRNWLSHLRVGPLFIEKGSPWENGYIESFKEKARDEGLQTIHHDRAPYLATKLGR